MIKNICFVIAMTTAIYCKAQVNNTSSILKPDERESMVTKLVAEMITSNNYKTLPLNDSLSLLIFDRYVKSLDQGRNYLTESDIESFAPFKTRLDEDLKNGDLAHVFHMFNVYATRFQQRTQYAISLLKNDFDFKTKESLIIDRGMLPYAKNTEEMELIWKKRVKYDLLVLSKTSADIKKNKQTLEKRYKNLLEQSSQLTNQDVFQNFMDAVTNSVDPHSAYFNPYNAAAFNVTMSRSLEGIGATLVLDNGYVTIKSLVTGGPAAKTEMIAPEDRIVAIAEANGAGAGDAEFKDVIGWRIDRVVSLIRGEKGTVVRLKLLSKGKNDTDEPKIVAIKREKIILEDQSAKKEVREYQSNGKNVKIGIINIPQFYIDYKAFNAGEANYKSTTRDVKLLIDSLKRVNVDGIVIDLRQNGGGSLNEAIDLTGLFIKTGPVVQVRDVENNVQVNKDNNPLVTYDGPLAVLVDRFSASASEIFSAAIQDYGRGIIIGSQTYGKGTVQRQLDLDQVIKSSSYKVQAAAMEAKEKSTSSNNQSLFGQFNVTIGKFYRISGSSTQHLGVSPDVKIASLYPLSEYGEDTEKSALPWDTIGKTEYVRLGEFNQLLPELNRRHESRFQQNSLNRYIAEAIVDFTKPKTATAISLNAMENKKEGERRGNILLVRNNILRKAMQLPPLKIGEISTKKEDLDFIKKEAGQILTDYISIGRASALSSSK